jgi:hypothetical protein
MLIAEDDHDNPVIRIVGVQANKTFDPTWVAEHSLAHDFANEYLSCRMD